MSTSPQAWTYYLDALRWLAEKKWRLSPLHGIHGAEIERAMAQGHADHRGCNYFITEAGRALLAPRKDSEGT